MVVCFFENYRVARATPAKVNPKSLVEVRRGACYKSDLPIKLDQRLGGTVSGHLPLKSNTNAALLDRW